MKLMSGVIDGALFGTETICKKGGWVSCRISFALTWQWFTLVKLSNADYISHDIQIPGLPTAPPGPWPLSTDPRWPHLMMMRTLQKLFSTCWYLSHTFINNDFTLGKVILVFYVALVIIMLLINYAQLGREDTRWGKGVEVGIKVGME